MMRLIPLKNNAVKTYAVQTLASRFLVFFADALFLSYLPLPSAMTVSATDSPYLSFLKAATVPIWSMANIPMQVWKENN